MNYCRFLKRQSQSGLKPGAAKRMENVFRPFICGDPRRDRSLAQDLGTSLAAAREECQRRCPAKFGLPAAPPAGEQE
ncbi:MAG: hypothetical protein ACM3X6_14150 [Patescibacteria group bacterium]